MSYSRTFSALITIYPSFYNDEYCQYFKEDINKWIAECFNAYDVFFKINIGQNFGSAEFYNFDIENDDKKINYRRLWAYPHGSYSIYVTGSGILPHGMSPNALRPPMNVIDSIMDKVAFVYQEVSDIAPPKIIAFGKNLGIPSEYTCENHDIEMWNDGQSEDDMYCSNLNLTLNCSENSFDTVLTIVEKLMELNINKDNDISIDQYSLTIEAKSSYILPYKNKQKFMFLLNELSSVIIQDDFTEVEKCVMDFIADKEKRFCLETYFFNEVIGKFESKYVLIETALDKRR